MDNWYFINEESEKIYQGELFNELPIVLFDYSDNNKGNRININGIVMTQACDLENNKVENLIIAGIRDISELPNKGAAIEINKGRQARYHLINSWEEEDLNYKVIDFSEIYSVPIEYIRKYKRDNTIKNICLNTPYVEYMSQRFGIYFSRIGLPNGIDEKKLKEDFDKLNK